MPVAGSTSTAFCGQTEAQGVLSPHCWHIMGTKAAPGVAGVLDPVDAQPGDAVALGRRSAAGGTLFSTAQATMQAPQPLHLSRSTTIP